MKHWFFMGLPLLLCVCREQKQPAFTKLPREVYVGYNLIKDTLCIARLLENNGKYELHRAALSEGQEIKQRVVPVISVSRDSLSSVKASLQAHYKAV